MIIIQGLVLSCAPGPWSAEQSAEHALGHHPLPRDLGWPGAGHQEAAEDVAVLLRPLCIQILQSGNILHLLEGKPHSSINPCIIKYQNIQLRFESSTLILYKELSSSIFQSLSVSE